MISSRHSEAKFSIANNWRFACYRNFRTQKACLEEDRLIIDNFVNTSPKDTPKYLARALWYFSEGIQQFIKESGEVVSLIFCPENGEFYVGSGQRHFIDIHGELPYPHWREAPTLDTMHGMFWRRSIAVDPSMPMPFYVTPELASAIVRSKQ